MNQNSMGAPDEGEPCAGGDGSSKSPQSRDANPTVQGPEHTRADTSVASNSTPMQPGSSLILPCDGGERGPLAHVVLYQPEIPQNTGNIGRTCVAVGATLWIVRPAAFRLDDRKLRRAGLDYWQHLKLRDAENWQALRETLPESPQRKYWYLSRFAEQGFWEAPIGYGDVVVFGSETSGLPESIHAEAHAAAHSDSRPDNASALLRLPTTPLVRSLNLSNTAAVVLYDLVRRNLQGTLARRP